MLSLQALRIAYDGLNRQGSFEAVLREADSAEAPLKRSPQAGAAPLLDITLLNQPKVFTLALVWESAKVRLLATISCLGSASGCASLCHCIRTWSVSFEAVTVCSVFCVCCLSLPPSDAPDGDNCTGTAMCGCTYCCSLCYCGIAFHGPSI